MTGKMDQSEKLYHTIEIDDPPFFSYKYTTPQSPEMRTWKAVSIRNSYFFHLFAITVFNSRTRI